MRRSWLSGLVGCLLLACAACSGTTAPAAPTLTAAPIVLATPVPTPSLTPIPPAPTTVPPPAAPASPTAQAAQQRLYVANTGGQGLTMRRTPGGDAVAVLPDGTALTVTGEEQPSNGRQWRQVRDAQGREGWVAAEFLSAQAPPPQPTRAISPVELSPTALPQAPLPPTSTLPVLIAPATPRPPAAPTTAASPAAATAPAVPTLMTRFSPPPPTATPTRTPTP